MCVIASTLLSAAIVCCPIISVRFAMSVRPPPPPPSGVMEVPGAAGPIRVGDVVLMLGSGAVPAFRIARVERIDPPLLGLRGTVDVAPIRARPDEVIPFGRALEYCDNRVAAEPRNDLHYMRRALVRIELGDRDRALADLDEAIRLNPGDPEAYLQRGDLRMLKDDVAGADVDHDRALQLHQTAHPQSRRRTRTFRPRTYYAPAFFINRAWAWMRWGNYAQALADCDTALRLDPGYFPALNDRAWISATCPDPAFRDPQEALADATRACELTDWKNSWTVDTLAAVYADRGDFAKAAYTEQQALDLCRGTEGWVGGYRARLELYKAEKPYREKVRAGAGKGPPAGAPKPEPASARPNPPL